MQVVGYETAASPDEEAALLLAEGDGGVERRALTPGDELAYRLGDRHCAGTIHDGGHVPCDDADAPYCDAHSSTWVCARCTGTCLKDEMDCYEEHAVYLAAFAPDIFKIGVTRSWRLDTRLREQGADRAAHLRTVSNGRIAREIEAELAADLTDRVRVPEKIAGLGRPVDADDWQAVLADLDHVETFEFDYGLDLQSQPVEETLASGTIRGVKGRVLVLDTGGSTYAVDLRDLVGHELESGTVERNLQSSLGAFGE
ncbi:Protein of unknown function [Natronoarchaeum philippinense]|uniref:DUF2797 domain-containing protein n=1 Tax=Natronoarchaeum philippinense TaxID=558529 RepID=A0A285N1G8_NATPI|nr:DUF2797 domain-containing protein [Natronoarchaeum philippinense]SNZ03280.1 Protein of unknown function [Natronoarchaeum philippinense]